MEIQRGRETQIQDTGDIQESILEYTKVFFSGRGARRVKDVTDIPTKGISQKYHPSHAWFSLLL